MKNLDLKQFADEGKLPIMDSIQFKRWTDEIGKENLENYYQNILLKRDLAFL